MIKAKSKREAQRVAIARAIAIEPELLLLDEPTANMDDTTEKKILNAIHQKLTPENTLIIVTHKPALLGLVDRIVVMTPQGVAMVG